MSDGSASTRVRVIQIVICVSIVAAAVQVMYAAAEQREKRLERCDERFGDDQWVMVEKPEPWYIELTHFGGHGPVECVSIHSERAEECVVGTTLADYNQRCAEL